MENTLFPIQMEVHIIFALVALFIFGMQFIRLRKKYYLVLAVAVPATLLAYVIDSTAFFYGLGIAEAVALIAALILSRTIDRDKDEASENAEETAEAPAQLPDTPAEPAEVFDESTEEDTAAEETE